MNPQTIPTSSSSLTEVRYVLQYKAGSSWADYDQGYDAVKTAWDIASQFDLYECHYRIIKRTTIEEPLSEEERKI
jgi:hypothetical protein